MSGDWDARGGSLWLDRIQWGIVMDALINYSAVSLARKAENSASTSDVTAATCDAIVSRITESDDWVYTPPSALRSEPFIRQGETLTPGVNVDMVDLDAGIKEAITIGYAEGSTEMMAISLGLALWARGEEKRATDTMMSEGVNLTSVYRIVAAARAAVVGPGDLVGLAEVADLAGVAKTVISNWRTRRADFPEPIASLSSGPVWHKTDILRFLLTRSPKQEGKEQGHAWT